MDWTHAIALIHGNDKHHLDHLAPLASQLGIPLIVTDVEIETLAKRYYPNLTIFYFDPVSVGTRVVSKFDTVISSLPKDLLDQIFFIPENLQNKKLNYIWCPHGNSDKGHASYFMEGLSKEKQALVYGKRMVDFLKEKGVYEQLEEVKFLGNYRHQYFLSHTPFYQEVVEKEIVSKLPRENKTVLYAPTWKDAENSSSLEAALKPLLEGLPKNWNLIVKPHPNLEVDIEVQKENALILKDFPPIYALLSAVDAYLGDMSSIGYDFLTFRKPMFFLNPNKRCPKKDKGLYLTRCGTLIAQSDFDKIFSIIEKSDSAPFAKVQEAVYNRTYERNITL
ncbi:CDP-glycerol glycerophosphotransferase family protein [Candidatus Neptunochlamydia vexilliferae]|nr:CDP-glycerol glycerophosphotransferase family protein [Candidatus Neptunochlamydia vexilliferae]